jgi:hypothetical protein
MISLSRAVKAVMLVPMAMNPRVRRQQAAAKGLLAVPLLLIALLITGCAQQYVVKLSSGNEITVLGKPKLKGNFWYCKDARGNPYDPIPKGRIISYQPASDARAEAEQNKYKPPTLKTARHWYWPF